MNTQHRILAYATVATGLAFAVDKPVKLSDLPPAVQKPIQEQIKGAVIKGFSTETEKGKTFYEAETRLTGTAVTCYSTRPVRSLKWKRRRHSM